MTPEEYFAIYVEPAFRHYIAAETALTIAVCGNGDIAIAEAEAMRSAMAAATPAWHLADWIWEQFRTVTAGRVLNAASLSDYRRELQMRWCRMLRGQQPVQDLEILGAVVDAFKHYELRNLARQVRSAEATVTTATGYGQVGYGEGKYGGTTQVVVTLADGTVRAFSSIIQNVVDMWRQEFGLSLPPIGT